MINNNKEVELWVGNNDICFNYFVTPASNKGKFLICQTLKNVIWKVNFFYEKRRTECVIKSFQSYIINYKSYIINYKFA